MKLLLSVVVMGLLSFSVQGAEKLVCKAFGRAETAEQFDTIKSEPVSSVFLVTKTKVITEIGQVFDRVNPEHVGLEKGTITYYSRGSREVLYLYQNKGKNEVGVSHLVEDSDAGFDDKDLFSECQFEAKGGTPNGATDASSRAEAGGSEGIKTSWRF